MPRLGFGDKASFDNRRTEYLELSSKGQKVHIRFLGGPVYEGKHFMLVDGKWNVSHCPRLMHEKECAFCEKFFAIKKQIKDLGPEKEYTKIQRAKAKELDKKAMDVKPTLNFYYPVLDRENEEARVFKATLSTRIKLDTEFEDGIKILDFDYIVTRTEKPGTDYYAMTRLDSSMIKPLTEKENEGLNVADGWDLEAMVYGTKASSFDMGDESKEENTEELAGSEIEEVELPEDLPF